MLNLSETYSLWNFSFLYWPKVPAQQQAPFTAAFPQSTSNLHYL